MSFGGRRSLYSGSGGGGSKKKDGIVGTVKDIDKAPNINEKKVKVRFEGARKEDAVYVPKKYAKYLKPEHKYEFHLEESTFRGGGQSKFSGSAMIRRIKGEPVEITGKGLGGGSDGRSGGGTTFRGS